MATRKVPKKLANDRPRCDRCHYYDQSEHEPDKSDSGLGYCRRYPITGNDVWQSVQATDWCGEYMTASLPREAGEHLSIAEAGKRYFGLSVNGSYLAARRGDLPWVRIGKQMRVPVSALRHLTPKDQA